MRTSSTALFLLTSGLLHLSLSNVTGATGMALADETGIVVESVARESALEKADLRASDVLLAWERQPSPPANPQLARGNLDSPFDWSWLQIEQAPRGTVKLIGRRQGMSKVWSVRPGNWEAKVRPAMSEQALALYRKGVERIDSGSFHQGLADWRQLTALTQDQDDGPLHCWILLRSGEVWEASRERSRAMAAYRQALDEACGTMARSVVSHAIAQLQEKQSDLEGALATRQAVLESHQAAEPSLHLAWSHYEIGRLGWRLGRPPVAEDHSRRALAMQETLAPESLAVARSLINLGVVAQMRGELGKSETIYQRVRTIALRLAPVSHVASNVLNNLAITFGIRGDVETAAAYCRQALEINQVIQPGSLRVATNLTNLAIATMHQGDLELAIDYLDRALTIYENRAPDDAQVVNTLASLGEVSLKQGRLETAKTHLNRALAMRRRAAPDTLEVAELRVMLGTVARRQDEPEQAAAHYRHALRIRESLAPGSLEMASSLYHLGALAHDRGDWDEAQDHYARALEVQERLAPGSLSEAQSLRGLGELAYRLGRRDEAVAFWRRSIESLETQAGKLASSEDLKGSFRSLYRDHYRDLVELLVEMDRPGEAFAVLERSRARSFLALLAEKDLNLFADLSADLERDRRRLAVLYDRTQRQLARLSPTHDAGNIDPLLSRLRALRRERLEIIAQVRRASPELAAVRYPQPLNLEQTRAVLDPGTVMLSYSVGKTRTDLFVVTRAEERLRVETLAVGEQELRRKVELFRQRIQEAIPGSALGASRLAALTAAGRELFSLLVAPAADALEAGERLLIIPDGPLHLLPFAALIRPSADDAASSETDPARSWQYLVEWKAIHSVLSPTVFAELAKRRRPATLATAGEPPMLVAFGDPLYPESLRRGTETVSPVDLQVRSAPQLRNFDWQPLPYSRREVEEISGLHHNSRTYVGAMATEERAKSIAGKARILHFATHSHFDGRFPMNSALVLTLPKDFPEDRDNGLLQAWEIFETVRLDADLVTLSACRSALGEERDGEGLIGLTRAFQYAGARSVAATLWSVADRTTPELMVRFYRHLGSGKPKDEALRAAQIELIRGPIDGVGADGEKTLVDASAPYYWAAFQIIGDWR